MTVKLRLMRMGKKKQPTYRIVAAESTSPRDGRFIEIVGTYAPRSEPSVVQIDNSKALRWLSSGAQPTDRVRTLLTISGAWGEFEEANKERESRRPAKQAPARKRATGSPTKADRAKTRAEKAAAQRADAAAKAAEAEAAAAAGDEVETPEPDGEIVAEGEEGAESEES